MFEVITHKLEQIISFDKMTPEYYKKEINTSGINSPETFYSAFVDLNPRKTKIVETPSQSDIQHIHDSVEDIDVVNIINLQRFNDVCDPEEFLEAVNKKLPSGGMFICHAETIEQRFNRIINKYPKIISRPLYIWDFLMRRVLPKHELTRKLDLFLTKGKDRVISLANILGFFYYFGFKIEYLKDINDLTYFAFKKERAPSCDCKPSSGMIFKTERIGKDGKIIKLFKLRTMHPYSEYIQQFVYDLNGSNNGDKLNDDFRVTSWGRFFRKYWIDELPMVVNWLKGDVKLVGVRPLSICKFRMYPPDLQQLRITSKPGLIPPFYADLPGSFDELLESERKYLSSYKKSPIKTDVKYFFKCVYNITIKCARSA